MDADLYVFQPTGELWDLVFSGRVWAPIYVAAEHPVPCIWMPDAIQRVFQTEIRAPSHPLKPESWVDSEVMRRCCSRCPELYRLELPADGTSFYLNWRWTALRRRRWFRGVTFGGRGILATTTVGRPSR